MAEGVRIQPIEEHSWWPAGSTICVVDHARPLPVQPDRPPCSTCGQMHHAKTYRLRLDENSTVIVSATVWMNLQKIADNPFEVANPVAEPPAQQLIVPTVRVLTRGGTL